MIFGWIGCVTVAILMARFTRDLWPERKLFGQKYWFVVSLYILERSTTARPHPKTNGSLSLFPGDSSLVHTLTVIVPPLPHGDRLARHCGVVHYHLRAVQGMEQGSVPHHTHCVLC